jgi:hypothetical protein
MVKNERGAKRQELQRADHPPVGGPAIRQVGVGLLEEIKAAKAHINTCEVRASVPVICTKFVPKRTLS